MFSVFYKDKTQGSKYIDDTNIIERYPNRKKFMKIITG